MLFVDYLNLDRSRPQLMGNDPRRLLLRLLTEFNNGLSQRLKFEQDPGLFAPFQFHLTIFGIHEVPVVLLLAFSLFVPKLPLFAINESELR